MNQKKSKMAQWLRAAGLGLLAFGALAVAHAQNAIEAVTSSTQSGSEVIRIDLAQPLTAVPAGFAVQTPARIALDFPGVTNAIGRSAIEVNQGNLRSVNVVQAGERSRVVLNLKQATAYKAEIQGKSLLVVLDPVANMYSKPSRDADVVSQAIYGANVAVVEEKDGWARIRTAGRPRSTMRA